MDNTFLVVRVDSNSFVINAEPRIIALHSVHDSSPWALQSIVCSPSPKKTMAFSQALFAIGQSVLKVMHSCGLSLCCEIDALGFSHIHI